MAQMRAARLLQILLMLQNRGRMTAPALASELEVTPRTILRDVDAMTEAGLPILVFQGNRGGIELGFNYRTRLTGLATDEAEALAIWLASLPPVLADLGMARAALAARAKLIESFPDKVRATIAHTGQWVKIEPRTPHPTDPRIMALARAIHTGQKVRLRSRSAKPLTLLPDALRNDPGGWSLMAGDLAIPMADWGDIHISQH